MKSRLKLWDHLLFPISCFVARGLRTFISLFREPTNKALIVRPGGMGDLVCLDLACKQLGLPSNSEVQEIDWLIERRSFPWATHRRLKALLYDDLSLGNLKSLLLRIAAYPVVVNTEQLYGLSQALALLFTHRCGRLHAFSTNRAAYEADLTATYDPCNAHETVTFSRLLAQAFGLSQPPESRRPADSAHRRPSPLSDPGAPAVPVVWIAGTQSPSRDFNAEAWETWIKGFVGDQPFSLICAEEDAILAQKLAEKFPVQARLIRGSFEDCCSTVRQASFVLTLDSAPVHIASFYGVRTISVFTSSPERKWAPLAPGGIILKREDLPCRPCALFGQVPPCPNSYACKDIDLESCLVPQLRVPGKAGTSEEDVEADSGIRDT